MAGRTAALVLAASCWPAAADRPPLHPHAASPPPPNLKLHEARDLQIEELHTKLNGIVFEWRRSVPKEVDIKEPPILFVHGSFHGAWTWDKWLPRFASVLQRPCHAFGLRGTAGSPAEAGAKSVHINQHVSDLTAFIDETLAQEAIQAGPEAYKVFDRGPVIVAHSMGAVVALKYLEAGGNAAGLVLISPVPPSGNGPMTGRFLLRTPGIAWLLTRGFAMKTAAKNPEHARRIFFDEMMSEEELSTYMERFAADSKVGINLKSFSTNLPNKQADSDGVAKWVGRAPAALVVGSGKDIVIDRQGVEETAHFLGLPESSVAWLGESPHDVMLASGWQAAADTVINWIKRVLPWSQRGGANALDSGSSDKAKWEAAWSTSNAANARLIESPPPAPAAAAAADTDGDSCERRRRRALSGEAAPADQEGWLSEWNQRLDCWWLALAAPTRTQLGACMGALGLHVASRLEGAWRAAQARGLLPPAPGGAASLVGGAGAAEEGCEWLGEQQHGSLALPELPAFPSFEGRFQWTVPPIPRLLPFPASWQGLQSLRDEGAAGTRLAQSRAPAVGAERTSAGGAAPAGAPLWSAGATARVAAAADVWAEGGGTRPGATSQHAQPSAGGGDSAARATAVSSSLVAAGAGAGGAMLALAVGAFAFGLGTKGRAGRPQIRRANGGS